MTTDNTIQPSSEASNTSSADQTAVKPELQFLKKYETLVKESGLQFEFFPQFVPAGNGMFLTTVNASIVKVPEPKEEKTESPEGTQTPNDTTTE